MAGPQSNARRWLAGGALIMILFVQALLGFSQSGDLLTRGHNGWNTGAYQQAARNSLRFNLLFPVQYYTGVAPPKPDLAYSHAPLGLHLHTTLSVWLFGDEEASVRGVAAVQGVLAVLMLFALTRRLWGDVHALVAAGFYVALPINGIYANMSNHASGFVTWSLATFYCYLRFHDLRQAAQAQPSARRAAIRWFFAMCAAYLMAAAWDWASNYTALAIALHWLYAGMVRQARAGRSFVRPGVDFGLVTLFACVVLGFLATHALLVQFYAGGLSELAATFDNRQEVDPVKWAYHLRTVPEYMFSWPVLLLCALWLVAFLLRAVSGRLKLRDLVPFTFAYGGVLHYWIFKKSAIVHEYWAWHTLPFVALACAVTWLWLAGQLASLGERGLRLMSDGPRARYGSLLGVCALGLLLPFFERVIEIVPAGRSVAGSMWFVGPVRRPTPTPYSSTRPELRFGKQVRAWTNRNTGVLRHRSLNSTADSPLWAITLDRELRGVADIPAKLPAGPKEGWVFVADRRSFDKTKLLEIVSRHPYYQYGHHFMLDLRSKQTDVRIWQVRETPMTAGHWFWMSPFEPPVAAVRVPAAEARLIAKARALRRSSELASGATSAP